MSTRSWTLLSLACAALALGLWWWLSQGQELATLRGHEGVVRTVAFDPTGEVLASGSDDQTIRIWCVASNRSLRTLDGHTGKVRAISFSPDGTTLASAGEDKTIRLWD